MSENWVERKRPTRLERRFEFSDYEETRDFLERAAAVSESEGYYPDMSFGRTHVSMALHVKDDETEVSEDIMRYAQLMDAITPAAQLASLDSQMKRIDEDS